MIKLLHQEAQCYFQGRANLRQAYLELSHPQQKVHFFLMLLYHNPDAPIAFLSENSTSHPIQISPLLTALWAYSLHLHPDSQEAKKLFTLVSQLQSRNFVQKSQLLSDLPQWVVQGAGLVEAQAFDKRIARVYTKINYQQSKHSLIRESNEGYTKLILLLAGLKDIHDPAAIWKKILSLIGNFDLDPDRVLDLIVDARIQNSEARHFLALLKNFRKESVVITIGNRLINHRAKVDPGQPTLSEKTVYCGTPQSFDGAESFTMFKQVPFLPNPRLSELTAQCIKSGLLAYSDLQPYLQPSDSALKRISGKRAELTLAKISKSFTMSMVQIDDNEQARIFQEENELFEGQLLYSSKLSLISEVVRSNNWLDFTLLWAPFKNKFDLILYQPLLHTLLDLMEWAIEPLLQPVGFQKFFRVQKKCNNYQNDLSGKDFPRIEAIDNNSIQQLADLMTYIGRYIGFRPRAFIKLCRIFKSLVKDESINPEVVTKIKEIIKVYIVPANGYTQENAAMALELYSLLECFDYQFRYQCYLLVYRETMTNNPYVARIFESIKRRQNIIVNNLSKENKKVFIRKIAKLTHNQALPVLYWIARRIVMEDYEAVVPEIVGVLSNATPLTLDMTIFAMLYCLNEHKEAVVNIKTHQFQPWFKNVITFISTFFRKYLDADIQPVFDYIFLKTALPFSELEDEDELPGALLKLLHSILNKMHGSVMIQEVNKTKFDAIAAGPKLQTEILELSSQVRAAKKSKLMLQKFFWEQNMSHLSGRSLAFNLLVLLIQKRGELLTKAFIDDLRIVADIFDEFTLLIVQIVRVLQYQSQDFSHYALLLPEKTLNFLLIEYKVPLELACEIVRPGMKHIAMMTASEWDTLVADFTQCYSKCLRDPKYLMKTSRQNEKVEAYLDAYKVRALELIPPTFFTTFWFLTIDSVYFPAKSYAQKIDDIKKRIDQSTSRRNDKQVERMKTLLEKLIKEEEQQRSKYQETMSEENLKKLEVDCLKGVDKEKEKKENTLPLFAQAFVQVCLLPRMMLDRAEALYCVKFTTAIIKANKMAATKSIRLITIIIEYVMNYLPFTTHREASSCLSVFLSEILAIFINWSDSIKLKQDLKRVLGIQQTPGKDNYPKLRDYLVKLFERVGNIVKSIKEEPYIIKNCLYLLEKVQSIPGYKQQADELMQHMNELKQSYTAVDMRTILDRQIAMLTTKKNELPEKPEERKGALSKPAQQQLQKESTNKDSTPRQLMSTQKPKQTNNKETLKDTVRTQPAKSPLVTNNFQQKNENNNRNHPEPIASKPSQISVSSVAQQKKNPSPYVPRNTRPQLQQDIKAKQQQFSRFKDKSEDRNKGRGQSRFSDRAESKLTERTDRPENKLNDRPESRFSDRPPQKKIQARQRTQQPQKNPKQYIAKQDVEHHLHNPMAGSLASFSSQIASSHLEGVSKPSQPKGAVSEGAVSSIPPPKRLSDVKRELNLQSIGTQGTQGNQQRDESSKHKQQETKKTVDSSYKDQKPTFSASAGLIHLQEQQTKTDHPIKSEQQTKADQTIKTDQPKPKIPEESQSQAAKQIKITESREAKEANQEQSRDKGSKDRVIKEGKVEKTQGDRRREDSQHQEAKKDRDSRWKEDRRWQQNKPKPSFNRDSKNDPRESSRREEKRDRSKEKDRQRKHEKHRSRSRDKFSRR